MTAIFSSSGNSVIPTQSAHDAHYSGSTETHRVLVGAIELEIVTHEGRDAEVIDITYKRDPAIAKSLTNLFKVIDLDVDALLENARKLGLVQTF